MEVNDNWNPFQQTQNRIGYFFVLFMESFNELFQLKENFCDFRIRTTDRWIKYVCLAAFYLFEQSLHESSLVGCNCRLFVK